MSRLPAARSGAGEAGSVLVKVLLIAAVGVPTGAYAYAAVRNSVHDQTLHSDMRNTVDLEAACNEDRNGAGYAAGSNAHGGAIVLQCGAASESFRPSSGNRLVVVLSPDGHGFVLTGTRTDTGATMRYDSSTGRWS